MKIALIEVKPLGQDYVAKEMAGGLGKRVRLENNLWGQFLSHYLKSRFSAPPIVLAQLAAVLGKYHHDIRAYYTSMTSDIERDTDIAVVLGSMADYNNEIGFIKQLKSAQRIQVIVVGSFASAMPDIYRDVADIVICGSPEAVVEKIARGEFPSEKVNQSEEPENLDDLPMVDWKPFIKNGYYARRPFSRDNGVSIQKSRGCSMTCNYCPYAAFYGKVKAFSSDYTLKTIDYYYHAHDIRYFMFRDPNFGENKSDFRKFMEALIKKGWKINFSCEARLDTFKDDDLILMSEAGLKFVIAGVESSDDNLLKLNARVTVNKDELSHKIQILERKGVIVQTNYILGFPSETEQGVNDTLRYAKELNSMFATFHIYTPQPGTQPFHQFRDKLLGSDWENYGYTNLVWQHDSLSKEFLENTVSRIYRDYYFRPQWFTKHSMKLLRALY